ncbi:MAG: glycosyltransferase family 4 protein [Leptospira sp.]|nr:glycosyltransferase family 4 protein [Leptospira sp.]
MRKFIIGVDARPLSTPMSGIGRLIHETLKAFPEPDKYEFYLYSHRPIHSAHKSLVTLNNLKWKQSESIFSYKGGFYYNLELPRLIRKDNLDLFWGAQQVLPPFLPKKLTCILGYMDLVLYLFPETMRPIARLQQKTFQRYSVKRSQHIISISEQTKKDMIQKFHYPESQASVAYPGIDTISIESFLNKKISARIQNLPKKYIISVSTIEPRKNYPFLLKVFRKIRESNKIPNLSWVIAGKRGWESDEFYKELSDDREKYNDIIVLEGLDDSELHHLYKNASLFWMASLYEGFGIPLLEALYHKKMAVVSDIDTFHEIGKNSIQYHTTSNNEKDIESWATSTTEAINKKLVFKGDISSFTWENSAKNIANVFLQFLN